MTRVAEFPSVPEPDEAQLEEDADAVPLPVLAGWHSVWRRYRASYLALAGLVLTLLVLGLAILAPFLAPDSPITQFPSGLSAEGGPRPPGGQFLLGTDSLGRDLLSRLIWGARTSMEIAILANLLSALIGVAVGAFAGYLGGKVDMLLMRLTDLLMAIPAMLLAAFLAAVFQPSITIIVAIVGFVNWFYLARIVRAEVLSQRQREYVEAARALGLSTWPILVRHILPQVWSIVIVYSTLNIATTVLFVASLSYVGIGVQQPTADWGNMIADGAAYLSVAPWMVIFPGIALGISVLGFNLLGDGLRDALDPRQRL